MGCFLRIDSLYAAFRPALLSPLFLDTRHEHQWAAARTRTPPTEAPDAVIGVGSAPAWQSTCKDRRPFRPVPAPAPLNRSARRERLELNGHVDDGIGPSKEVRGQDQGVCGEDCGLEGEESPAKGPREVAAREEGVECRPDKGSSDIFGDLCVRLPSTHCIQLRRSQKVAQRSMIANDYLCFRWAAKRKSTQM
ncbi:hypothetical protein LY76DRAFT_608902 [Colletotrichum caudatum]|nr:hypothetical protein LY76DRAFT_608902 [Colletotrichum caudatum]